LNKKCSKELLKLIVYLPPKPSKIKKNLESLYINNGVNKPIKKFVCSGCWKVKKVLKFIVKILFVFLTRKVI
jgi:hypothetical protein